ncbi:MAG: three-Cys-motif partner protein TcmP [Candidatus Schekmanbacteria bacterium]|nr:three-Cys-motif partner protein TcmP [Candidatus Schekmanbacteria bacterium]
MTTITSTTWKIEPHTEAKLEILRKYLNAWLPIITRWNGRVLYIDAFAGPGEYSDGKNGSPIVAIKAVTEHKAPIDAEITMLFIEADPKRCKSLENKISSLSLPSNLTAKCICGKFDETLTEILDYIDDQKKMIAPAFVFIDPFGFSGIPFSLIQRIMSNKKCEVLINFMYEDINRFIKDKKLWPRFIETFGTDLWKKVIFEKNPKERMSLLHNIYEQQLEQKAGIKYVRSFKMINRSNKTDYFLFFGTNDLTGLKKMKEAMWKVDKIGTFQFSDATFNPGQTMLFESEPDFSYLKKEIINNFKGKTISIEELENFVLTKTSFRETHYKRQILAPMEKTNPPAIIVSRKDAARKKGFFPAGCVIEFL